MPYQPSVNVKKTDSSQMNGGTLNIQKNQLVALCDKWNTNIMSFVKEFGDPGFDQVYREIGNKEANQLFNDYVSFSKAITTLKQALLRSK